MNGSGTSGRNRMVAFLLAFFLGWLGFHKFYLGQITKGILMLLFCWTGVPVIIGFVESIMLLAMSEETFHHKFG